MGRIGGDGRERFVFVDALRGMAALAVFGFHLTPMLEGWPRAIFGYGWSGVQAFFVVSGFVIAHSVRDATPTGGYVGNFILRRSLRLDPPYWCVLALVLVLNQFSNLVRREETIPFPGWGAIVAHLFYLQHVLGYEDIVNIFWSLCFEMQMYLVFILTLALCRRLTPAGIGRQSPNAGVLTLLLGLAAVSLTHQTGWLPLVEKRWFLSDWYAFFLGVLAYWTAMERCPKWWFYTLATAVALVVVYPRWNVGATVALLTAGTLFVAARRNWLATQGLVPGLPFFGTLSYSFYLIHTVVLARLTRAADRYGAGRNDYLAVVIFGAVASFLAAYLLFRFIESPCMRLSKRFKSVVTGHPA